MRLSGPTPLPPLLLVAVVVVAVATSWMEGTVVDAYTINKSDIQSKTSTSVSRRDFGLVTAGGVFASSTIFVAQPLQPAMAFDGSGLSAITKADAKKAYQVRVLRAAHVRDFKALLPRMTMRRLKSHLTRQI
jgi:hypothetical protein